MAAWVEELRLADIRLCLVSNGRGRRIRHFAQRLRTPCISTAMKPLPWGLRAAMDTIHSLPLETAIVGDQIFADVMAGRLAGSAPSWSIPFIPRKNPGLRD